MWLVGSKSCVGFLFIIHLPAVIERLQEGIGGLMQAESFWMKLRYTEPKQRRERDSSVHNQLESIESCLKLKLSSTKKCFTPHLSLPLLVLTYEYNLQKAVARGQIFSGLCWRYSHKEAMQFARTANKKHCREPCFIIQNKAYSKNIWFNIWFNHAFNPLEAWVDINWLKLGCGTVWGTSLKFLRLFINCLFIQVNKQVLESILNRERVDND